MSLKMETARPIWLMNDSIESHDAELMRRVSTGDEAAFSEIYQRHQGGLYRFALHMTGKPECAADVVQETFLTLIRQAKKFDREKGAPAAFLYGIARNHVRKVFEKEKRYLPFSSTSRDGDGRETGIGEGAAVSDAESALEGLERAEIEEMMRAVILTLPDHYREVVTLCDLEGKSYEDSATLLDCPVGTVRSRLNRARSILLEKLRPYRLGTKALGARSGGKS
jgi:RNA polymerase sigma-70 factor (ECF subfamily)